MTSRAHLTLVQPLALPVAEPSWLPAYVRGRSLADNAGHLARPLWGDAAADRARSIAQAVPVRFPEAVRGKQSRGWVAGVLWAVALEHRVHESPAHWREVLADISRMTGASAQTARRRYGMLHRAVLDAPGDEPEWWD